MFKVSCEWNVQIAASSFNPDICAQALQRLPPPVNVQLSGNRQKESAGNIRILHWNSPEKLFHQQYLNDYVEILANDSPSSESLEYFYRLFSVYQQLDGDLIRRIHNANINKEMLQTREKVFPQAPNVKNHIRNEHSTQRRADDKENTISKSRYSGDECRDFRRLAEVTHRVHAFYFNFDFASIGISQIPFFNFAYK